MLKSIGRPALFLLAFLGGLVSSASAQEPVEVRFKAVVGDQPMACGKEYDGIGVLKSKITPKDFRFYIRDLRVIDDKGAEVPVDLEQDGKWQLDGIALLDFEDRTGSCEQGTPDLNDRIKGTVPTGTVVRGIRFRLGIPAERNHAGNLRGAPPPLNLTALIWSWGEGYLFMRMDYEKLGDAPRSWSVHVGDIQDNLPWPDVRFMEFDPSANAVVADLAALLETINVEQRGGCMGNCPSFLPALGIGRDPSEQTFFRKGSSAVSP